jgi:hypothetical protein
MSVFCPDGYVLVPDAVLAAAKSWFPLQIDLPLQPQVRDALYDALNEAAHRLRNLLHQGELEAYYFGSDGRHSISRDFWATTDADVVMESGIWHFGEPSGEHSQRPVFLKESELDALLTTNKRPLPQSKVRELAEAMRKLEDLTRVEQRAALRQSTEFGQYHITDDQFREAERQVPRRSGRKRLRPEQ